MKRNGKVTPMTRLIERAEFEKRLADYTANVLKSFNHVLQLIASQQQEIEALKKGPQVNDATLAEVAAVAGWSPELLAEQRAAHGVER